MEKLKKLIQFQKRKYMIEEFHEKDEIVGKYCIGVEVPGVNHNAKVFVIGVRGYDNGEYKDGVDVKDIKRPAIFETEKDCALFAKELYFPDSPLRVIKITDDIFYKDIFPNVGAYLVRKPLIHLV